MKVFFAIVLAAGACLRISSAVAQQPTISGKPEPVLQEAYAGYWTDEPGWHTELEIRNNLRAAPIEVTPVLRLADGSEISLSPRAVQANSAAMVDVSAELEIKNPALAGKPGTFGSVVFRYTASNSSSVFAAAMVERTGEPIKYHFDAFPYTSEFTSTSVESVWWLPKPSSTDVLIVANMTDKPIAARVSITDSKGKSVALSDGLAPRQTKRLIVRELVQSGRLGGTEGGVSVTFDKPVGVNDVQVSHFVHDETNGFSALLRTFSRDSSSGPADWTFRAPMVALSRPDPALGYPADTVFAPKVMVRNASSADLPVGTRVNWRSASTVGNTPVATRTIKEGETVAIDIAALQNAGHVPRDAQWATVSLSYHGRDGDMVPIAMSYEPNGPRGLQTPFSPAVARKWKGSMWHVDDTRTSLITVGNGGANPTTAVMVVHYGQNESYELRQRLAPGEQMWADVAQIIREQRPDVNGMTIPPETHFGTYDLLDFDNGSLGQLYEGKLTIDRKYGYAVYGCAMCCLERATMYPSGVYGYPGAKSPVAVRVIDCEGSIDDRQGLTGSVRMVPLFQYR